jgi:hypothetical protein
MTGFQILELIALSGIGAGIVKTLVQIGRVLEKQDSHSARLDDHDTRLGTVETLLMNRGQAHK